MKKHVGLNQYAAGDLVRLKSGGPTMTVADISDVSGVRCQWFAGKKMESGWFPPESLIEGTDDEAK